MTTAEEFKAKGNAALQAGKTSEAIEHYTAAIHADGSNHVYFSNRSAAYLKKGDANNALEDANSCIGLNPNFAKGYSRKGAALHALKRYNDSIAAYKEGLAKFPNDAGLKKGLEDVQQEKENPGGIPSATGGGGGNNPLAQLFGTQAMARIATDPKLRHLLNDEDFMQKMMLLQNNPNLLPSMMQDPKIMMYLNTVMGGGGMMPEEEEEQETTTPTPTKAAAPPKKKEPEPMEQQEEEDWSNLSPEERAKKEKQKAAVEAKTKGNDLYKSKNFTQALEAYDEAIELDPTNMTFLNNKAAVYFTTKDYDKCIQTCLQAVEVGNANMAPFEDRAKAFTRCAKAYQKKGNLESAIEYCQKAQLESYDKATQRLLKTYELEKRKADTLAYQNDDLAQEAKQRGNDYFRKQQWSEAVVEYEEAVKRAPKNAAIRNNLSAALCKIMDFNGAKRQVEVALELDPKYTKAWARKGDIEVMMKEYHKALESYKAGLETDPHNVACREGLKKTTSLINYGNSTMTESEKLERAQHAMADPEIQAILNDPVIQQILKDFNENPSAAQEALQNATVRSKIEKLIASGVIETR